MDRDALPQMLNIHRMSANYFCHVPRIGLDGDYRGGRCAAGEVEAGGDAGGLPAAVLPLRDEDKDMLDDDVQR